MDVVSTLSTQPIQNRNWTNPITLTRYERDAVSNHWRLECLFNNLLKKTTIKHIKAPQYWSFVRGNHQWLEDWEGQYWGKRLYAMTSTWSSKVVIRTNKDRNVERLVLNTLFVVNMPFLGRVLSVYEFVRSSPGVGARVCSREFAIFFPWKVFLCFKLYWRDMSVMPCQITGLATWVFVQ